MTTARHSTREAVRQAIARRRRREVQVRWWTLIALSLAVLAADQATKVAIRATMEQGERTPVFPGFSISRVTNEGIAFGLFPGRQSAIAILTVVALCAIAVALAGIVARNATVAAGAGLLVGGSLGNLVDRLALGAVTDFLDVARWPAFNVADMGIVAGAVLIVMGLLRDEEDEEPG